MNDSILKDSTDMNDFEKVETLRSRANVSYEEARDALKEANGDLLDAIVLLERKGRTSQPAQTSFSTSYEEQPRYERVEDKVDPAPEEDAGERFRKSFTRTCRTILGKLKDNEFLAWRHSKGNNPIRIPLWLAVLLLFLFWNSLVPVMVLLMFFGWRYGVEGQDDMRGVNDVLNNAGDLADSAKEAVKNEWNNHTTS